MKTKELKLTVKEIGKDDFLDMRNQLNDFVHENWQLLYEGASRLGKQIGADYYAPKRVQINNTRLHLWEGLKYADGHKYTDDHSPTEENLKNTVLDLQELIDAAATPSTAAFELKIIEKN